MIIFQRNSFITVGEVWYDQKPQPAGVDIIEHYQRDLPTVPLWSREFHTIRVDLRLDQDELLARMGKNNRYKILRAGSRDGLTYECWHPGSAHVIDEFCDFFENFARLTGLHRPNRHWLRCHADAGVLDISRIKTEAGQTLAWHTHFRQAVHSRLLHSASVYREHDSSPIRNMVGRANRYHHWRDMLRFKSEGIEVYDFGGWYAGQEDDARLRINRFKEEFGGQVVKQFNCLASASLRGKAFLWARLLRNPSRRWTHMV